MRFLLSIEHPAWAHQFRYIINELINKGHEVKVVAINKDRDLELLDAFNIEYEIVSNSSGINLFEKMIIFFITVVKIFKISLQFKPDLFLGRASPMMSLNSYIFQKPHIVFEDTEHSKISLLICRLFSTIIFTPESFQKDLGKKHVKIPTYKELFYLHPKYFSPNPSVLKEVDLTKNDIYIILRLVSWTAHHDFGHHGILDKRKLVKELEKYGRVLITSEKALPKTLEKYRINISPEKFHDLLSFSALCVGEGGTVASEAAVLGVHSIFISTLGKYCGVFSDQARYGLQFICESDNDALMIAKELLENKQLKMIGKVKQKNMLKEKIDVTGYLINFIENYPASLNNTK